MMQARYQMFNPDAARPARRIYVGGLPPDTEDVRLPTRSIIIWSCHPLCVHVMRLHMAAFSQHSFFMYHAMHGWTQKWICKPDGCPQLQHSTAEGCDSLCALFARDLSSAQVASPWKMLAQVDLRQYIYELMVSTGGCASAGYPIASCKIYSDKSYAFLEFRSVEEASNCMAFDGVAFKDSYLRVC